MGRTALCFIVAHMVTIAHAAAAANSGLRAMWYDNALLAHQPCVAAVPDLSLNYTAAVNLPPHCKSKQLSLELFTARLDGVLTAPAGGSYQFRVVTNGAVRLWLDDHILVDTSCDAPLQSEPLMAESLSRHNTAFPSLSPKAPPQPAARTQQKQATPHDGRERVGSLAGNCKEWDVPAGHATVTYNGRDNVTHRVEKGLHLRLEWLHYGGGAANLKVLWRVGAPSSQLHSADSLFTPIPASAMTSSIPAVEQWRQDLQAKLSHGWNTWMRDSAARHVHLPSGFGFEVSIFDTATNESFREGLVDKCNGADANSCKVIPGYHSFNGSATSYVHRTQWDAAGMPITNVTISSAHAGSGDEMVLLVEPSRRNTTLWAIFTPGFFFDCAIQNRGCPILGQWIPACGHITVESPSKDRVIVHAQPSGQRNSSLTMFCPSEIGGCRRGIQGRVLPNNSIAVPLSGGAVSISGFGSLDSTDQIPQWISSETAQAITTKQLQKVTDSLDAEYPRAQVGRMRDSAEAMRTVIGWNTVWDQRVKVFFALFLLFLFLFCLLLFCLDLSLFRSFLCLYSYPCFFPHVSFYCR